MNRHHYVISKVLPSILLFYFLLTTGIMSVLGQSSLPSQKSPGFQNKAENRLIELEKSTYEFKKAGKFDLLKELYAGDFRLIGAIGFKTRDEYLGGLQGVELRDYSLNDMSISFPAKNVCIVIYKLNLQGSFKGFDFSGDYFVTSVWIKRGKNWLMFRHMETKSVLK